MTESVQAHSVAKVEEIPPGERKIVSIESREIGILNVDNTFYAFRNICPHAFAPICLGRVEGRVTSTGPPSIDYDTKPSVLMCPWHLWEFDLETGCSLVDPSLKLKKYKVEVSDGEVLVYV